MTTLITNDLRAIDFDHVRMTCVAPGDDAEPWVSVLFENAAMVRLFNVAGYDEDQIALLIARVVSHCMESTASVVLEDVIIKEWMYAMHNAKERKDERS